MKADRSCLLDLHGRLKLDCDLAFVLLDEESRVRCKDIPSISIDGTCIDLAWSGKSTSANWFGVVKDVSISRTK